MAVGFAHLEAPEAHPTCDPLQWVSREFCPLTRTESKGIQAYSMVEAVAMIARIKVAEDRQQ